MATVISPSISIAVFSDDRLFCQGVVRMLSETPGFTATGFSGTSLPSRRAHFRVALCDARMRSSVSIDNLLQDDHAPPVIFVCAPEDDEWARDALLAGARGIVPRTAELREVLRAIEAVVDGELWARRRWLTAGLRQLTANRKATNPMQRTTVDHRLSERERDVLQHAATGMSNRELADRLCISQATVKSHLARIFRKLGVNRRSGLAAVYYGLAGSKTGAPVQEKTPRAPVQGKTSH